MAYPPPPYKDAVAGTFVAGEAIVGKWWAYPPQRSLRLLGILPQVAIIEQNEVPEAKLTLVGTAPSAADHHDLGSAGTSLLLKAYPPTGVDTGLAGPAGPGAAASRLSAADRHGPRCPAGPALMLKAYPVRGRGQRPVAVPEAGLGLAALPPHS